LGLASALDVSPTAHWVTQSVTFRSSTSFSSLTWREGGGGVDEPIAQPIEACGEIWWGSFYQQGKEFDGQMSFTLACWSI